jgi:hypothetical protein
MQVKGGPSKGANKNMLRIFERRILRRMFGPIEENCILRSRNIHELNNEPDIVKAIKVGRLK